MSLLNRSLVLGTEGSGCSAFIESLAGRAYPAGSLHMAGCGSSLAERHPIDFESSGLWMGDGDELLLYTPVRSKDALTVEWASVVPRFQGICLLLDNRRPRPLDDLRDWLSRLGGEAVDSSLLLGVTHCDAVSSVSLDTYRDWLLQERLRIPVLQLDPRCDRQAKRFVECLFARQSV